MDIVSTVADLNDQLAFQRSQSGAIGFVPTMGALHEGHVSLIRACTAKTDCCVVSIFVNPLQFSEHEDFDDYPRCLDDDIAILKREGVSVLFCPTVNELYLFGPAQSIRFDLPDYATLLCGQSRPHFFEGVCSVVLRLFMIVRPDCAFFGEKDYQQGLIIQQMCRDLFLPIEIEMVPIVREVDGLAMSSRNRYLNSEQRQSAVCLYQLLTFICDQFRQGILSSDQLLQLGSEFISKQPAIQIDYLTILSLDWRLNPDVCHSSDRVLVAAYFEIDKGARDCIRLIDNMPLLALSRNTQSAAF